MAFVVIRIQLHLHECLELAEEHLRKAPTAEPPEVFGLNAK